MITDQNVRIYFTISGTLSIVNILLWGCESLTIRKENFHMLEVFSHSIIGYTLNISKWQQATTRLSNKKRLRRKFDFILNMQETIDKRRLDWLGNVARQPASELCKHSFLWHGSNTRGPMEDKSTCYKSITQHQ
jgi:hypothetical protein